MPSGGPRRGAGRPRGSRMEPVRRSLRAAVRGRLIELVERGGDPLAFLANLVADPSVDLSTRLYAAEVLLPYCAPRQNGRPTRVEKAAKTLDIPS